MTSKQKLFIIHTMKIAGVRLDLYGAKMNESIKKAIAIIENETAADG